jgi:DNA repair exonuclease SbcCD ATPase subunit
VHTHWKGLNEEVDRLQRVAAGIVAETDPHMAGVEEAEKHLAKCHQKIEELKKTNGHSDLLSKHFFYVHKAYHDRTKIKSLIFRDHLPFINQRLKHYLEVFDLDVKIEITDSLGISSNMWGYEFESGGERKRTDVALMLAIFDFHESIYGRQCNVLVLDEVDGRLDESGVDSLIGVIKDDIAHKVETVLIISHKNSMFDTFQKEIRVKRSPDRLSRIQVG